MLLVVASGHVAMCCQEKSRGRPVHHVTQIDHKHARTWLDINPGFANANLQTRLIVCG